MGTFSHELDLNGESGRSYRVRRRSGSEFDDGVVDEARNYFVNMGHVPIMSTVERSAHGTSGLVKVLPEMTKEEMEFFNHETGLIAEAA